MVDLSMMVKLVDAPNNARLILLGDKDQLASALKAGRSVGDICSFIDNQGYSAAQNKLLLCERPVSTPWAIQFHLPTPRLRTSVADNLCMLQKATVLMPIGIGQLAKAINSGRTRRWMKSGIKFLGY